MKYSAILCSALIIILGFYIQDSSQSSLMRCRLPKLINGRIRQRPGGRAVRFNCLTGFTLVGSRSATCRGGRWSAAVPLCIRDQCEPFVRPSHALTIPLHDDAFFLFFCEPGYERRGSPAIYCDGRTWNATVPTCTKYAKANPPTSCNFENYDLCSWEQDPFHDFDWTIHNFNTPSWHISTGPSHDHTLGKGRSGYYLYIEADDKLENSTARIMSPLYSSDLTDAGCFSFWYHMYGETIGTLNVYIRVEGRSDKTLLFTKSGNQGNHWLHGLVDLPKANNSFQFIVEGVRGASYLSDIAIDDIAILQGNECTPDPDSSTEISTTENDDQIEIVNGMQTCLGRCTINYTNPIENSSNLCQCDSYCSENQNCCPDYTAYCILTDDTMDSTVDSIESTTRVPIRPKLTSTSPDRMPTIPANPKDDIDPYSTKILINPVPKPSDRTIPVSTKRPPMTTRKPITTSTVRTVAKTTTKDEKFDNQLDTHNLGEKAHSTSSRERGKVTLPGIIAIVVGAIVGIAGTVLIVFMILQKRNSYKKKSGTSALSDDSDVRFLTSDEMLDFNIAKPEDMEM